MNAKLFEIVFERLAESQLSGEESNLVLAACQGDEALQSWLSEGLALEVSEAERLFETGDLREGVEAFLQKRPARFS